MPTPTPLLLPSGSALAYFLSFVACWAAFADYFCYASVIAYGPEFLDESLSSSGGASSSWTLFTLFSLASLLSLPFIGEVAVDSAVPGVFVASAALLLLSEVYFAVATTLPHMIAARCIQGVSSAGNWTAALALLSIHLTEAEVARVNTLVFAVGALGSIAGPKIGAVLYDLGGPTAPPLLGAGLAFSLIIFGLVLTCFLPRADGAGEEAGPPASPRQRRCGGGLTDYSFLADARLRSAYVLTFLGAVSEAYFNASLPQVLGARFGLRASGIGDFFLVMSASYCCTCLVMSFVVDSRADAELTTIMLGLVGTSVAAVAIALAGVATTTPTAAANVPGTGTGFLLAEFVCCGFYGCALALVISPVPSLINKIARRRRRRGPRLLSQLEMRLGASGDSTTRKATYQNIGVAVEEGGAEEDGSKEHIGVLQALQQPSAGDVVAAASTGKIFAVYNMAFTAGYALGPALGFGMLAQAGFLSSAVTLALLLTCTAPWLARPCDEG